MFTGIIEEKGRLRSLSLMGRSGRISVNAAKVLEGTKIGDSIAVNGVWYPLKKTDLRRM